MLHLFCFFPLLFFDISGIPILSEDSEWASLCLFLFERSLDAFLVSNHTPPPLLFSDFVLYPCSSWQLALCGEKNE